LGNPLVPRLNINGSPVGSDAGRTAGVQE